MPGTRKLGRATDSRNAMLRAMVTYLFENGKIETTVTRAKEVRAMAEKMVTLGKSGDLHTKRQIFSYITKEDVAQRGAETAFQRLNNELTITAIRRKVGHLDLGAFNLHHKNPP